MVVAEQEVKSSKKMATVVFNTADFPFIELPPFYFHHTIMFSTLPGQVNPGAFRKLCQGKSQSFVVQVDQVQGRQRQCTIFAQM